MTEPHYLIDELNAILQRPSEDAKVEQFLEEGPLGSLYLWDLEKPDNLCTARELGKRTRERLSHKTGLFPTPDPSAERQDAQQLAEQVARNPVDSVDRLVRCQLTDGSTRWYRSRALTLRDGAGKALRVLGYRSDVTALVQREHPDMPDNQLLTAIVTDSQHAIFSTDLTGVVTSWNHGAEQLLGYAAQEMLGQSSLRIVPEHSMQACQDALARLVAGEAVDWESTLRTKSGEELDVAVMASALRDASNAIRGTSMIVRDIRQQKARDTELRRSNAALEQFASIASHDLHEPLRMVGNYTDLLARRYHGQLDDKGEKYLRYVLEGTHRMQALVGDLLTYARVSTKGKPFAEVSVSEVLAEVLCDLDIPIQESDASFDVGALPLLHADRAQLHQLLQNLVSNALKYRGPNTPSVVIRAAPCAGGYLFSVADNGTGFSAEEADQLFQMFRRLNRHTEREGTGIGLAICRRIVERHGGEIWVESTLGQGSVFYFTLAARPAEQSAPRPPQ